MSSDVVVENHQQNLIKPTYVIKGPFKLMEHAKRRLQQDIKCFLHIDNNDIAYIYFFKDPVDQQTVKQYIDHRLQLLTFEEADIENKNSIGFTKKQFDVKQSKARTTGQCLKQLQVYKNIKAVISIDFESFTTNPLILSELGMCRVENGKIVATLHCFFNFADKYKKQISGVQKKNIEFSKRITGIPGPYEDKYNQCVPQYILSNDISQFSKLIQAFCCKNQAEIRALIQNNNLEEQVDVQLLEEFETSLPEDSNEYVIVAQGKQMEYIALQNIFNLHNLALKIQEATDILFITKQEDLDVQLIHSAEREYKYCKYHKNFYEYRKSIGKPLLSFKKQTPHCALDDAIYQIHQLIK